MMVFRKQLFGKILVQLTKNQNGCKIFILYDIAFILSHIFSFTADDTFGKKNIMILSSFHCYSLLSNSRTIGC